MNKAKRIFCLLLSGIAYFGLIYLPLDLVPKCVNLALSFFSIPQSNYSMIASLITAVIFFAFSSNGMYAFLHKKYTRCLERSKRDFLKMLMVTLISANDVWVAIPKRTILFSAYLAYSILDKLGYVDLGVDLLFVGVFIIGVDRVAKSWKDEKKKLFALGRKAYSEDNNITDSVIG